MKIDFYLLRAQRNRLYFPMENFSVDFKDLERETLKCANFLVYLGVKKIV